MKPLLPVVRGKTEFDRFDNALRQVLSISKEDFLKMEAREKRKEERKRKKKLE